MTSFSRREYIASWLSTSDQFESFENVFYSYILLLRVVTQSMAVGELEK